jgi:hypothetical protein
MPDDSDESLIRLVLLVAVRDIGGSVWSMTLERDCVNLSIKQVSRCVGESRESNDRREDVCR